VKIHAVRGVIQVFGLWVQRGAERADQERESSSERNNIGAPQRVFLKGGIYTWRC
jgi:hypothetical protein